MRIVVTGGAGFIGSALVRHLVGHTGHEVMVVDKDNLMSTVIKDGYASFEDVYKNVPESDRPKKP